MSTSRLPAKALLGSFLTHQIVDPCDGGLAGINCCDGYYCQDAYVCVPCVPGAVGC